MATGLASERSLLQAIATATAVAAKTIHVGLERA